LPDEKFGFSSLFIRWVLNATATERQRRIYAIDAGWMTSRSLTAIMKEYSPPLT
jgi:hypothetical protein